MKKFDPAKLDEDWDIMTSELSRHGREGREVPPVAMKDGPHVFLPNFMINFHEVSEKSDMDAYVARLGEVARVMDQAIELAKLAAAEGNRAPRFAYDQSIQEAKNVIAGAPFGTGADSPLWADVKSEIKKLQDGGKLTAEEATAVQASASAALTEAEAGTNASCVARADKPTRRNRRKAPLR
jgi:uncharacterized protein (DUF885 family)